MTVNHKLNSVIKCIQQKATQDAVLCSPYTVINQDHLLELLCYKAVLLLS